MSSIVVTALCNQPEAFASDLDLDDDQSRYLYIIGQVYWKRQAISDIVSKYHELWSTNGLEELDRHFTHPTNSAFHFIARLYRRRLAYGTQPIFAKR